MVCWVGSTLMTEPIDGDVGRGACVWNPKACEMTWNPEMTLNSDGVIAAPGATVTLATRWAGFCSLKTHTRRTVTSSEPNPTVMWFSSKRALVAVMSMAALAPAGRALRVTELICGGTVTG